jgi:hypothetical protein
VGLRHKDTVTTNETPKDSRSRRRRRRGRLAVALVLVLVLFGTLTARFFVWPNLQPIPPRVDAIIELGGAAMLGRDRVANELAEQHRAPFLVQSTLAAATGTHTCLPPVPDVTVLCFHADPNTTRGEAQWIGKEAASRHWTSIVLVTTPDQALRARLRVTRCFPGKVYVATSPLPPFDWPVQIAYQWTSSAKALIFERGC